VLVGLQIFGGNTCLSVRDGGIKFMEQERQHKNRPFGLYIIIGLELALAVFLALALLNVQGISSYLRILVQNPMFYSWYGWVMIGCLAVAALGLFFLKRWGWILTMILTGIGLSYTIWSYFQGSPSYLAMIMDLVIVFYLNQREVQLPFMQAETP
jgi:hypothetical protein